MKLRKFIATTIREYLNEQQEVDSNLVKNYTFDNSRLEPLIKNARKWRENDFIEEYVDLNDITIYWGDSYFSSPINKGDEVILARTVRDNNGNVINRKYSFYKKVIADKDYGTKHWDFIMDNTKELQDEAKKMYHQNKLSPKPKFNKNDKTIKGYHVSPNKFNQFKYGEHSESGQLGADFGFFFFKDLKNAKYYANVIKDNNYPNWYSDEQQKIINKFPNIENIIKRKKTLLELGEINIEKLEKSLKWNEKILKHVERDLPNTKSHNETISKINNLKHKINRVKELSLNSDEEKLLNEYLGEIKKLNSSVTKKAFLYECTIRLGNYDIWKGEDVGTNWGRVGDLEQADIEGYDVVIIEDADTGYGITDEIVVFDNDNIKIDKIIQI